MEWQQCCSALGLKPSSMSAVTITVLKWKANCFIKISLYAGIAVVSRGTRKRDNLSGGAANQQGRPILLLEETRYEICRVLGDRSKG